MKILKFKFRKMENVGAKWKYIRNNEDEWSRHQINARKVYHKWKD